jgi:hypothetical protein
MLLQHVFPSLLGHWEDCVSAQQLLAALLALSFGSQDVASFASLPAQHDTFEVSVPLTLQRCSVF